MKNTFLGILFLFFVSFSVVAQIEDSKWSVGLSASFIKFSNEGKKIIGERFNVQFPKINVVKYLSSGFYLEGGLTYGAFEKVEGIFSNSFNYFSLDGAIIYDFNAIDKNVLPYVSFGGSIIGAPKKVIPGAKTTPTLNFSGGITFWVKPSYGINFQGTYKYSPNFVDSMYSHLQFSFGLVYSFTPRNQVARLWNARR